MKRRSLCRAAGCLAAALLAGPPLTAQSQPQPTPPLPSLAVLDFELVDDQNNPLTKAAQEVRLRNTTAQLRQELADRQLYRVIDLQPAAGLLETLRSQQEFIYRCEDCAAQVGRQLGVDLVMATWVQKVSELILNLNVLVYDVAREQVVLTKSVDLRGNDDVTWARAVRFLVRDMADKRARNPAYGR